MHDLPKQKTVLSHALAWVAALVGVVAAEPPCAFVAHQALDDEFALVVDGKTNAILGLTDR